MSNSSDYDKRNGAKHYAELSPVESGTPPPLPPRPRGPPRGGRPQPSSVTCLPPMRATQAANYRSRAQSHAREDSRRHSTMPPVESPLVFGTKPTRQDHVSVLDTTEEKFLEQLLADHPAPRSATPPSFAVGPEAKSPAHYKQVLVEEICKGPVPQTGQGKSAAAQSDYRFTPQVDKHDRQERMTRSEREERERQAEREREEEAMREEAKRLVEEEWAREMETRTPGWYVAKAQASMEARTTDPTAAQLADIRRRAQAVFGCKPRDERLDESGEGGARRPDSLVDFYSDDEWTSTTNLKSKTRDQPRASAAKGLTDDEDDWSADEPNATEVSSETKTKSPNHGFPPWYDPKNPPIFCTSFDEYGWPTGDTTPPDFLKYHNQEKSLTPSSSESADVSRSDSWSDDANNAVCRNQGSLVQRGASLGAKCTADTDDDDDFSLSEFDFIDIDHKTKTRDQRPAQRGKSAEASQLASDSDESSIAEFISNFKSGIRDQIHEKRAKDSQANRTPSDGDDFSISEFDIGSDEDRSRTRVLRIHHGEGAGRHWQASSDTLHREEAASDDSRSTPSDDGYEPAIASDYISPEAPPPLARGAKSCRPLDPHWCPPGGDVALKPASPVPVFIGPEPKYRRTYKEGEGISSSSASSDDTVLWTRTPPEERNPPPLDLESASDMTSVPGRAYLRRRTTDLPDAETTDQMIDDIDRCLNPDRYSPVSPAYRSTGTTPLPTAAGLIAELPDHRPKPKQAWPAPNELGVAKDDATPPPAHNGELTVEDYSDEEEDAFCAGPSAQDLGRRVLSPTPAAESPRRVLRHKLKFGRCTKVHPMPQEAERAESTPDRRPSLWSRAKKGICRVGRRISRLFCCTNANAVIVLDQSDNRRPNGCLPNVTKISTTRA